jgi:stearoyl-CoA desaturase (Delta-9 desaturase)
MNLRQRRFQRMAMLIFFLAHWQLSVFFQSFFLHRYGAHRQFTMSPRMEKVFHFLAWFVMGSSYLSPRAYAILHRMHHAYSDTDKDPHSPQVEPNFFRMMYKTKILYRSIRRREYEAEPRFIGGYPEWKLLDETLNTMFTSIVWGTLYTLMYGAYAYFTKSYWVMALVPFTWFLGPIHGAIVNYLGHKLGYRNFESEDASRNTLIFDFLTMGELFQNNHHKFGQSPNFGARWFEIDPAYLGIRLFGALGLVDLSKAQKSRYVAPSAIKAAAASVAQNAKQVASAKSDSRIAA